MTELDYRAAFTELFGFVETHPTFLAAQDASVHCASFRDTRSFWHYKTTVGNAFVSDAAFDVFQHDPLFHFCTARHFGRDEEALAAARARDPQLLGELLAIGDSPVGYLPGTITGDRCTVFHTRHCAQLTFLLHNLRRFGDPRHMHVLEVGGGYGNMPRLLGTHSGFGSWTILDLPFMSRLQRWYLAQSLPGHRQEHDDFGVLDGGAIRCVDTEHRNEFVDEFAGATVLLSTHAWSEVPRDEFLWYQRNLPPKVDFLCYAAAAEFPGPEETQWRLDRLQRDWNPVDVYWTHDKSVITAFLQRR